MEAEKIKLKVEIIKNKSGMRIDGSKDLYCEMITPAKNSVTALIKEENVTPTDISQL